MSALTDDGTPQPLQEWIANRFRQLPTMYAGLDPAGATGRAALAATQPLGAWPWKADSADAIAKASGQQWQPLHQGTLSTPGASTESPPASEATLLGTQLIDMPFMERAQSGLEPQGLTQELEEELREREQEHRRLSRELDVARRQSRQAKPVPACQPLQVPEGWPCDGSGSTIGTGHLLVEWQQARSKSNVLAQRLELEKELSLKLEAQMRQLRPHEFPRMTDRAPPGVSQASRSHVASTSDWTKVSGTGKVSPGVAAAHVRSHPSLAATGSSQPSGSRLRRARPELEVSPPQTPPHPLPPQPSACSRAAEDQPASHREAPRGGSVTPPFSPPLRQSGSQRGPLRSQSSSPPRRSERDEVDMAWCHILQRLPEPPQDWRLEKERPNIYRMSGFGRSILTRVSMTGLQVRVGGGWMDAEAFLLKHGPFESDGGRPSAGGPPSPPSRGGSSGGSPSTQTESAPMDRLLAPTISWSNRLSARRPDQRRAAMPRGSLSSRARPE